jgi:hypothetical protein
MKRVCQFCVLIKKFLINCLISFLINYLINEEQN